MPVSGQNPKVPLVKTQRFMSSEMKCRRYIRFLTILGFSRNVFHARLRHTFNSKSFIFCVLKLLMWWLSFEDPEKA